MAVFNHACEKILRHYQAYWSKRKDQSRNLEGDYHGQRLATWFLWKKALNHQILNVVYVEYVEIKHPQAAPCPTGYGASPVASELHRFLSMSDIKTLLKNGSVKPSGSSEGDSRDVQLRRGTC